MKKKNMLFKTMLVLVLSATLILLSSGVPTFSWFARPQSQSGNALEYGISSSDGVFAYDGGGVSMTTYISNDDGISFSDSLDPAQPVDFSNAANRQLTLGTTSPSNRVYYKTILENTTQKDQNVSLYIKNFNTGSAGEVCVGVNVPIKAFKNYSHYNVVKPSPSKTTTTGYTTKRVYFEPLNHVPSGSEYNSHRTTWSNKTYYVKSGSNVNSNVESSIEMNQSPLVNGLYYADIPANHSQLYFSCAAVPNNYERTQTFTNLTGDGLSKSQSLLFKLNGKYSSYNNAWCDVEHTVGANLMEYCNTAQLGVGDTIDLSLDSSQYTGANISYSITEGASYASVNASTGVLSGTTTSGAASRTVKVKYTVTSQFGDTRELICNVKVKSYASENNTISNAPIVTNLLISGNTTDNKNKQEVYWFIQNGDETYGVANNNASVSFDAVYLGV